MSSCTGGSRTVRKAASRGVAQQHPQRLGLAVAVHDQQRAPVGGGQRLEPVEGGPSAARRPGSRGGVTTGVCCPRAQGWRTAPRPRLPGARAAGIGPRRGSRPHPRARLARRSRRRCARTTCPRSPPRLRSVAAGCASPWSRHSRHPVRRALRRRPGGFGGDAGRRACASGATRSPCSARRAPATPTPTHVPASRPPGAPATWRPVTSRCRRATSCADHHGYQRLMMALAGPLRRPVRRRPQPLPAPAAGDDGAAAGRPGGDDPAHPADAVAGVRGRRGRRRARGEHVHRGQPAHRAAVGRRCPAPPGSCATGSTSTAGRPDRAASGCSGPAGSPRRRPRTWR